MKKVIYWIVSVLEVALLIGAGLVNYYTPRRMGMFRFVGYKNMMWEERQIIVGREICVRKVGAPQSRVLGNA